MNEALTEFVDAVPQTYGEAVGMYGRKLIECEPHEWDNRTTSENAAYLIGQLVKRNAKLEQVLDEAIAVTRVRIPWIAARLSFFKPLGAALMQLALVIRGNGLQKDESHA